MIIEIVFFAQTQTPNLMGLPNPQASSSGADGGSWWPFAMAILSLLVAAVSAGFAAWVKLNEKKVDKDTKAEQERTKVEIEQLKLEFEQRKQFEQSLQKAFKDSLEEGRQLRLELTSAIKEIHVRDKVIAELRGNIESLKMRIRYLEDLAGQPQEGPRAS